MSDKLVIYLSFKSNDISDIELYNWICKNNYKSAFIKSLLRQAMQKELSKNTEN